MLSVASTARAAAAAALWRSRPLALCRGRRGRDHYGRL